MEPNKILESDVLDILFEGRNKDYGAYELRKKYNKRILLALGITAALALLAVGGSLIAQNINSGNDDKSEVRDLTLQNIEEPPPPPLPPPPPKVPPPPPEVELTKFTPPIIKKDEEVKEQEMPPQEDLKETKIAEIDQKGEKDLNIQIPPVVEESKGTVVGPTIDENEKFTKVEIEARVDIKQWRRHLETNLQRYIEDARDGGMPPGQYTIQVRFLVERDGSVTEVQALSDPGYGLAKGAVDVLKKGPRWTPGVQNGRNVRSYQTQPITFLLQDE